MTHDPGFDDPAFDSPDSDHSPLNSAELEAIKADMTAAGMTAAESSAWLADDGPDGARHWYRTNSRQNAAFQNASARRDALRAERERNAPVDQLAAGVVARDVAEHGSGARTGKVVIVPMIPGASIWEWFGTGVLLIALAIFFLILGFRLNVPHNASEMPSGRVEVTKTQTTQIQPKLTIAPGTPVDFTFTNLTNSTCPPNSIGSRFGAGYLATLNPDGSLNFTHQANSPLAPDLKGASSGTAFTADGQNEVEKLSIKANVDRLVNPTSLTGKASVTFPGVNCGGDFDASGTIGGPAGSTVPAEPPKKALAGTLSRQALPMRAENTAGGTLALAAFLALILVGAALVAAAARLAMASDPYSQEQDGDDQGGDPGEQEGEPVEVPADHLLGFDPEVPGEDDVQRMEIK